MKRIGLVQVGFGTVGGALLEQVIAHQQFWKDRLALDIRIDAIVGRNGVMTASDGDGLSHEDLLRVVHWRRAGASRGTNPGFTDADPLDLPQTGDEIRIVLDAATGESTVSLLVTALDRGHGVVLSNKAPLALPMSDPRSRALWSQSHADGRLRYEATCGAGLPVISSIQSLLDTGDEVVEIRGALSGTFGAIFSDVAAGMPLSRAVRSARDRGFTEPDPRDDLSGLDVARKALILARTIGRETDLDDVTVRSLVPDSLAALGIPEYLARLEEQDAEIGAMGVEAVGAGSALKYVAQIPADGAIEVGLRHVPVTTVLGALQGPENIVSVRTNRYDHHPVVISGPGAGAAVTAAGMVADMLSLARQM
jgi:homoserine dehydrogenase